MASINNCYPVTQDKLYPFGYIQYGTSDRDNELFKSLTDYDEDTTLPTLLKS